MFSLSQYLLLSALLAHCLLLQTDAAGKGRVVPSPPTCDYEGKQYQLNARWPSTKPGECGEYTCKGPNSISGVGCASSAVAPKPDQVCEYINMPDLPYPYCCPQYHCVDKDDRN